MSSKSRAPSIADLTGPHLTGKPNYPGLGGGLGLGLGMSRPGTKPKLATFISKTLFLNYKLIFYVQYLEMVHTNMIFFLDLRQSRQSLVSHNAFDGRQSRASKRSIHRQMSRSRSRDRLTSGGAGYLGDPRDNDSLGEEDSDNWAGTSTDNNW